jgi:hypothetical protein
MSNPTVRERFFGGLGVALLVASAKATGIAAINEIKAAAGILKTNRLNFNRILFLSRKKWTCNGYNFVDDFRHSVFGGSGKPCARGAVRKFFGTIAFSFLKGRPPFCQNPPRLDALPKQSCPAHQ